MKPQIRVLAFTALFITAHALGQGTVNFLNDSVTLSSPPDRLVRFGNLPTIPPGVHPPAYGTNLAVQLYYGASTAPESSLVPVSSAPARLRASTSVAVGTWSAGGFRTLTGFDFGSGVVNLQVRVWDLTVAPTYELYLQSPFITGLDGKSAVFQYLIPASSGAPGGDFAMKNFTSFLVGIPEPSSLSLVGLGAGVLLILRRRK